MRSPRYTWNRTLASAALALLLASLSVGSCGEGDPAGSAVSGRVVDQNGAGIPEVMFVLFSSEGGCGSEPQSVTAKTDASGYYIFYTGNRSGSIALSPVKIGYIFTPASRTVTAAGSGAVRDQDFVATRAATDSPLASIIVTPENPAISIGTTQQFTASGRFSDGSSQDLTAQAIWSSSDTATASISGTGLANGISPGQTTISATVGPISGTTVLTVSQPTGIQPPSTQPTGTQPAVPFVFAMASAGHTSSFAIKLDHSLWAWGDNEHGQLGDGTNISRNAPAQIMPGTSWKSISSGGAFAFTASAYFPSSHTMAVKSDNTLWAWGYNDKGQLGNGTTVDTNAPVQIGADTNWAFVAAGQSHTVAIKLDGTLWAWGYNLYGELGDGTTADKTAPVQIGASTNWVTAAAGAVHTIAIKSDGTLWAWGANHNGQLGDGTGIPQNVPVQIGTETAWASVSAGFSYNAAIKADGTLWAWGNNQYGQLGDGTTLNRTSPVRIGNETDWASVAAGYYSTFAVKIDGSLWAWGWNGSGLLGDGTLVDEHAPVRIGVSNTWARVTAGIGHTMAVTTDGRLWSWGENAYGEIGDGTNISRFSPVNVP